MSDIILARVSQTLATEQSLESLVRQLLEMLELVTNMESTYLTKIDTQADLQHIVYSRNSGEMNFQRISPFPRGEYSVSSARWTTAVFTVTMFLSSGPIATPPKRWVSPHS